MRILGFNIDLYYLKYKLLNLFQKKYKIANEFDYRSWAHFNTAIHEAGHTLLVLNSNHSKLINVEIDYVYFLSSKIYTGCGRVRYNKYINLESDIEDVKISLAGIISQFIYCGKTSTKSSNDDLNHVKILIRKISPSLHGNFPIGIGFNPVKMYKPGTFSYKEEAILYWLYHETKDYLKNNKEKYKAIVKILLKKDQVTWKDFI